MRTTSGECYVSRNFPLLVWKHRGHGPNKGTGSFSSLTYSLLEEEDHFNLVFVAGNGRVVPVSVGIRFDTNDIASGYLNGIFAPRDLKGGCWRLPVGSTNPI